MREEADMTLQDRGENWDIVDTHEALATLALRCQESHADWSAARDQAAQSALGALYRQSLEHLWAESADDLRRVARGWIHSNMAPDIESLALNMFANVVVALPRLRIDPARNTRNLLVTVARRGLIDEYRRSYAAVPPRPPRPIDQPGEGQTWRQAIVQPRPTAQLDTQVEIPDPHSATIEDDMAARIDQQAILQAVWEDYWPRSLSAADFLIMELRWRLEPPCSFREIAERLGVGWAEDSVRQRHHRIIHATRRYLRARGLIDENSAP
jgi:hypothetical protein